MDIFKQASRLKLRVQTPNGLLGVEQLWDLSLNKLAGVIKDVKKLLNGNSTDGELDFLDETRTVDPELQLTFDVLKDIYVTKKSEADAAKDAANKKAHNEKIMALIHKKQEASLENKSEDELKAMLLQ